MLPLSSTKPRADELLDVIVIPSPPLDVKDVTNETFEEKERDFRKSIDSPARLNIQDTTPCDKLLLNGHLHCKKKE
jgi:hypothetical protein